ncbi:hypothetical protein FRB96_002224 [Tulasnella sp. 330]|nr:hypothetical protein FRB96_002224 [Tulasnella sp. 330]KAG8875966.1 hypothetical protein FRB97_004547 [Tulasnella sp. 331]KAG8881429.1 hypothetical protein FRB98_004364 [Tulasnella sp. 332]
METKATTVSRSFEFNNGNKIPWIGFGTGTAFIGKDVTQPILDALSAGYTHIDTGEAYLNEDSVGVALNKHFSGPSAPPRDSIFVTTKLYEALQPGQTVHDRLKISLKKLQLDYVDLYLVHIPTFHDGKLKDIWKQMEGVKKEGLAKNIGVSNWRVKDYKEFIDDAEVMPVNNQIEYNPYLIKASEHLIAFQQKYGIITSSFGSLIPLHTVRDGPLAPILPAMRERYSKEHGVDITDEQILIKWTVAKGVLPITTSSKKERLLSMIKTYDLPDLQQSDIDQIDAACGQEHRRVYIHHPDDI